MELIAPSRWACVDFISDLHLQATEPVTFHAWSNYLLHTAANAVFILGDLFEVWVGDDVLSVEPGFERECVNVLGAAAARVDVYIMCGNRDFLMGESLMSACGATYLQDPAVLAFANQRWLLTHGDALCVDDADYMQFRSQVRTTQWQSDFLAKPLPERLALARAMRTQSEARKRTQTVYADVDTSAANALLGSLHATRMVHGHTHHPAKHALSEGRERLVLSDWDLGAQPPRAEVLRLRIAQGTDGTQPFTLERIPPSMAVGGRPAAVT